MQERQRDSQPLFLLLAFLFLGPFKMTIVDWRIWKEQSIPRVRGKYLGFLFRLSVGAIVSHVVQAVFHMDSWAGRGQKGTFTKPKLYPLFKTSIVVCERKTN